MNDWQPISTAPNSAADPALPGLALALKICEYNKRYTFQTGDLLISEAHGRDADAIRAEIVKRTKNGH